MPKIHFLTPQDNTSPKTESPPNPKKTYRLTNWPDYNKALIQRGAITLWLNEQTLAEWYYQGPRLPGGFCRYRSGGPLGYLYSVRPVHRGSIRFRL